MKKLVLTSIMIASVAGATPYVKGTDNDPEFIAQRPVKMFSLLPTSGELSPAKTPWSNSFWPSIYGGIAFRWNGFYNEEPPFAPMHYHIDEIEDEIEEIEKRLYTEEHSVGENIHLVSKIKNLRQQKLQVEFKKTEAHKRHFFDITRPRRVRELLELTQEELDKLSPAEKFDAYMYMKTGKENNFKLTRDVLDFAKPTDPYWVGICDGWTSASLEFKEPRPLSFKARGLTLNLASSDLKALLSYYHAAITKNWLARKKVFTGRVGRRCNTPFSKYAWFTSNGVEYYKTIEQGRVVINRVPEECVDTNPGAFHIVLANMIGLRDKGFSAEVVVDQEVWNQPVFKYETTLVGETSSPRLWASPGTTRQVEVKTVMHYANDGGRMYWRHDGSDDEFYAWWERTTGTTNYRTAHKEFHYYLDIDSKGKIIGGQWLSYDRPDFLWEKKSKGFIGKGRFFGIVNYLDGLKDLVELQ